MLYVHTRDARTAGKRLVLKGTVLFCLGLTFAVVFFWTAIIPALMLLPMLIGLMLLYDGAVQVLRGGTWWIRYDGEQLRWQAPAFAEESFTLANCEIEKVTGTITHASTRRTRVRERVCYSINTHSGKTHHLTEQSGVDVTALVEMMRQHGVPVEEAHD